MIRRNNILFICLISLLFFAGRGFFMEKYFVFAENSDKNFFFKKNLKIGDNDEDVRFLQKILMVVELSSVGLGFVELHLVDFYLRQYCFVDLEVVEF
jgi:hypothetical protein